jgi:hypothetical protein
MRRLYWAFFLGFLIAPFTPAWASAHALHVDCKLRGDKVHLEAYFDDDTAAAKAKVQVVNVGQEVVADGVTDQEGRWTFATPPPGKYEVRVDAGAGHRAKKAIEVPPPPSNPAALESETSSTSKEAIVPDGPDGSRLEITRTPWLKVAIGLIIIGGLSGAFLLASMMRKNGKAKEV